MATIESPPNSVWPNGLQTDSEGYVNFYPLGTNKIDISTITWPEGTEVKSPFVYQDDKLVGFIDTKALDIDNNNTTIDISYTHFDADLDSIMENTLTINAPANADINVKYGAVDKVLTEKIEKLIGKGKCEVKFDKDNNKANIVFALDITQAQIAEVGFSLIHVLPSNLITDVEWTTEWADGLPTTYTRLEYLEATGTQYIDTDITFEKFGRAVHDIQFTSGIGNYVGFRAESFESATGLAFGATREGKIWYSNVGTFESPSLFSRELWTLSVDEGFSYLSMGDNFQQQKLLPDTNKVTIYSVFSALNQIGGIIAKTYTVKIYDRNGKLQLNFIPCLNDIGTPGMYDTVTKVFKSNMGTGDFLYPTDAAPAMSAGLDEKFYAKLTEHGVRRLYHVPAGCTMTKDEYAAANGFKELVEPPAPLEGYWMPVWRETETQLICDWVETEAPTEEVETLNNED